MNWRLVSNTQEPGSWRKCSLEDHQEDLRPLLQQGDLQQRERGGDKRNRPHREVLMYQSRVQQGGGVAESCGLTSPSMPLWPPASWARCSSPSWTSASQSTTSSEVEVLRRTSTAIKWSSPTGHYLFVLGLWRQSHIKHRQSNKHLIKAGLI